MDTYNLSPLGKLLKSRKFLLLVLDTVVSIVLFAVANYFPSADASAKFLVGSLQPVFVAIIIAISIEDSALTRSVNSK